MNRLLFVERWTLWITRRRPRWSYDDDYMDYMRKYERRSKICHDGKTRSSLVIHVVVVFFLTCVDSSEQGFVWACRSIGQHNFHCVDAIQKARSNEQDAKRNTSSSLTGLGGKTSIGDPNTIQSTDLRERGSSSLQSICLYSCIWGQRRVVFGEPLVSVLKKRKKRRTTWIKANYRLV